MAGRRNNIREIKIEVRDEKSNIDTIIIKNVVACVANEIQTDNLLGQNVLMQLKKYKSA